MENRMGQIPPGDVEVSEREGNAKLAKMEAEAGFNAQHPELQEGEIWITNAANSEDEPGWRTSRRGDLAYAKDGKVIPGYYPVFAQRSELLAKWNK